MPLESPCSGFPVWLVTCFLVARYGVRGRAGGWRLIARVWRYFYAMRFSVSTADGVEKTYDGTYSVDGGVLTVRDYDSDQILLLSPAFWQTVQAHSE